MRKFAIFLLSLQLIIGSCAPPLVIVGIGAGTGTGIYAYVNGDLTRSYQVEFAKTITACITVLAKLKMQIKEKTETGIQTTLKALRANDIPVTVKITMISPKMTEVSVRSGVVGIWDKQVAKLIHSYIAYTLINEMQNEITPS